MNGIELIAAERQRQIEVEGWTAEHDDEHGDQDMARAAACYARPRTPTTCADCDGRGRFKIDHVFSPDEEGPCGKCGGVGIVGPDASVPTDWPWDDEWWKPVPDDRVRELTKAGALIAAEIDRLLRAASEEKQR